MATKFASHYRQDGEKTLKRVSLGDSDNTIEGGAVLWVQDTALTGERTITVMDWDKTRHAEYTSALQPHVMIKCAVNASVNNLVIADTGATTLFTFDGDHSSTPAYLVLRVTDAGAWELA